MLVVVGVLITVVSVIGAVLLIGALVSLTKSGYEPPKR